MQFKFKNLGLLDEADIQMADLTVICGDNNTGKTYATYAIYGFLREWKELLHHIILRDITNNTIPHEKYEFDLKKSFSGKLNTYLSEVAIKYKSLLPMVFASKANFFDHCEIKFSIEEKTDFHLSHFQRSVRAGSSEKVLATLNKEPNSDILKVLITEKFFSRRDINYFVADAIADIVFAPYLPRIHISSAERTGASIFRKELEFARTRALKAINEMNSKELQSPFALFQKIATDSAYAWPVEDNVDFVRELENIGKKTSELAKSNPKILAAFDDVINGTYKVIKEIGLVFQCKAAGKQRFTMNEASSCVRALLDVGFYLRCKAIPGDLFIIDEPELNLHPKNQRALARLIVRLVNAGIKIFITTHSDYLIKEFNTLIMLNQRTEHTRRIQQQYKYEDAELLDPNRVQLYITGTKLKKPSEGEGKRSIRINTLNPAKISPDCGIEVSTFDETIDIMNTIQNELLYGSEL